LGNFVAILPIAGCEQAAARSFSSTIAFAKAFAGQLPSSVVEGQWVQVASYPRRNQSGAAVVSDPKTGDWILALGTWFHADGFATGDEQRLLTDYQQFGAFRLARALQGFFNIIIADEKERALILITDLVGSCHCYERDCGDFIAFSSSSLLLGGIAAVHLDPVGCQEFVNAGVIYENRTLYREVRKLPPASICRFSGKADGEHQRYWQASQLQPESLSGDTAAETLWNTMRTAALRVGRKFPQPICDLTGGYDSRALVAAFLSVGVPFSAAVSGPEDSADVRVSRRLAEMVALRHVHTFGADQLSLPDIKDAIALTDGEYNLVEYAGILRIHRQLSQEFDISINGSFGELARGYWWELLFPCTGCRKKLDSNRLARARFAARHFDATLFSPAVALDLAAHFSGVIERTNSGLAQYPNTFQMDHLYLMMRMQCWQGRIASSTNRLWACLSPFMFRSVLEVMLQTETKARQRSLLIRKMLARFYPAFANAPLEHGYPAAPLNWTNWYRFLPLAKYYGSLLLHKAGFHSRRGVPSSDSPPRVVQLWGEPEIREIWVASRMACGALLDQDRLESYIADSQKPGFRWEQQWMRLLSLELTCRALQRGGGGIHT
jgi:asparagine synthase (glutamine-hydrolysing)